MTSTIASPFVAPVLPVAVTVAPDAADAQIEDLARGAFEDAEACEEEFLAAPDAHAEDMAAPGHGGDYDPCAICEPYNHDRAVADVATYLREQR